MKPITANFAIISVKKGRKRVAKHLATQEQGIPVTITGYLVGEGGRDDGIDQEFEMIVTSIKITDD